MAREEVLDDALGREADQAEAQAQQQHEGAEAPGLGLPRQLQDDEDHVEHVGNVPLFITPLISPKKDSKQKKTIFNKNLNIK